MLAKGIKGGIVSLQRAVIESGILSEERPDEAVTRILVLKASLRLLEKQAYDPENPNESPYGGTIVNSYCHAWSCAPAYFPRKFF